MKLKLKGAQRGMTFVLIVGLHPHCVCRSFSAQEEERCTHCAFPCHSIQNPRRMFLDHCIVVNSFVQAKTEMGTQMKDASFALAVAKVAAHPLDITYTPTEAKLHAVSLILSSAHLFWRTLHKLHTVSSSTMTTLLVCNSPYLIPLAKPVSVREIVFRDRLLTLYSPRVCRSRQGWPANHKVEGLFHEGAGGNHQIGLIAGLQ